MNKGGNSADSGNGALGGSVNFSSKNVDDILLADKTVGGRYKTAYSSKNKQKTNSVALAFRKNGFEGFVQFTHRKGKEIQPHSSAKNENVTFNRLGYYIEKYRITPNSVENETQEPFYYEGCGDQCEPHYKARLTRFSRLISLAEMNELRTQVKEQIKNEIKQKLTKQYETLGRPIIPALLERIANGRANATAVDSKIANDLRYGLDIAGLESELGRSMSEQEKAQYLSQVDWQETQSAQDYTGIERAYPDPLDSESRSWLSRLGYHFNEDNYLGWLFEDTKQRYDSRDMTTKSYYSAGEVDSVSIANPNTGGIYFNKPIEGAFARAKWANARFIDEQHHKQRHSLSYIFNGGAKWVDRFEVNLDWQKITLDNHDMQLACSEYPAVDKNCRANASLPGSSQHLYHAKYGETRQRIGFKYDKLLDFWGMEHRLQLTAGFERLKADFDKTNDNVIYHANYDVVYRDGKRYAKPLPSEAKGYRCQDLIGNNYCDGLTFRGHNRYISLRDNFTLTQYVDLGFALRHDVNTLESPQSFTTYQLSNKNEAAHYVNWQLDKKRYHNTSWNLGVVLKPFEFMDIAYRLSSGFRVPNFVEYFGQNPQGAPYLSPHNLQPEKSFNRELGLTLKSSWGYFTGSYYLTSYKGLIGQAKTTNPSDHFTSYHNYSNVDIAGYTLEGVIDLNAIWAKMPEGLTFNASYERAKGKRVTREAGLTGGILYPLDAIQPPRTVLGLNYDSPNQTWGLRAIVTHSREKNLDEIYFYDERYIANNERKGTKESSGAWLTWDVIGYWNLPHNISINAGIYNLFNKRYANWEAIRQSSFGSLHRHNAQQQGSYRNTNDETNFARYLAPGRNFTLGLEVKF